MLAPALRPCMTQFNCKTLSVGDLIFSSGPRWSPRPAPSAREKPEWMTKAPRSGGWNPVDFENALRPNTRVFTSSGRVGNTTRSGKYRGGHSLPAARESHRKGKVSLYSGSYCIREETTSVHVGGIRFGIYQHRIGAVSTVVDLRPLSGSPCTGLTSNDQKRRSVSWWPVGIHVPRENNDLGDEASTRDPT